MTMMAKYFPTAIATLLLLGTVIGVAAGLVARQPSVDPAESDRFWSRLEIHGIAAEHYSSLAALTKAADLVVVGRIVNARPGRVVRDLEAEANGADPLDSSVAFIDIEIAVDEVLAGVLPDKDLVVEFVAPDPIEAKEIAKQAPADRSVWFLRNVGRWIRQKGAPPSQADALDGLFRPVLPDSLVRDASGRAHPLDYAETKYLVATSGESFDRLVQRIRAVD